jgi:hypothetical protein
MKPNAEGKIYIYDENVANRIRLPKHVGEVRIINGKEQYLFFRSNKDKKNEKKK